MTHPQFGATLKNSQTKIPTAFCDDILSHFSKQFKIFHHFLD